MKKSSRVLVLRLGHRPLRDKRITSHVGLVARAFGADRFVLNTRDDSVISTIDDVCERWGGDFKVEVAENWRGFIRRWNGVVVHLTMYGLPLNRVINEIQELKKDLLIVVGAEKVPPEVFKLADFNVAIGSQPHSEVSALAVFLDRLYEGRELLKEFKGRIKIDPSVDGKKVVGE